MVAEAIVRLAEDILFKDTFGQPYAIINMTTHEVILAQKREMAHMNQESGKYDNNGFVVKIEK